MPSTLCNPRLTPNQQVNNGTLEGRKINSLGAARRQQQGDDEQPPLSSTANLLLVAYSARVEEKEVYLDAELTIHYNVCI